MLIALQLFMIILNCAGISDRPQHAQDVNGVLSNLIALPPWSVCRAVCHFNANSSQLKARAITKELESLTQEIDP